MAVTMASAMVAWACEAPAKAVHGLRAKGKERAISKILAKIGEIR
jgi:hypothetical protein